MSFQLDTSNQTALVTGASRGIGKEIALSLAKAGAYVIGTGTTPQSAATISKYLGDKGTSLVYNTRDNKSEEQLFEQLANKELTPSILVNNAGITRDNLMLRMSDDEWAEVIATNLTAVARITRMSIKPMIRARFGRIINVSSVVASLGNAGQGNYAASKGGIEAMTKALARELSSRNITVNAVAPGYINTDMTKQLSESQAEQLMGNIPMHRLGEPSDIASGVVFLASNQASYITGHTLHINGGMLMS